MCQSKIHGAVVTQAKLEYEGSLTIDAHLMKAAGILPYEQVHVVDITNGARLVTYCLEGPSGSGMVCINGAAARLVAVGDRIIVITYAQMSPEEITRFVPTVLLLEQGNRIRQVIRSTDEFLSTQDPLCEISSGASA